MLIKSSAIVELTAFSGPGGLRAAIKNYSGKKGRIALPDQFKPFGKDLGIGVAHQRLEVRLGHGAKQGKRANLGQVGGSHDADILSLT